MRKSAVPLLQKLPGPKRVVEFIEDVTVHPEVLADYMSILQAIFDRHDVDAVMYGHVGDGNIHTRPAPRPQGRRRPAASCRPSWTRSSEVRARAQGHPVGRARRRPDPHPVRPRRCTGTRSTAVFETVKTGLRPRRHHEPRQEGGDRGRTGGDCRVSLRYGPDYWTYDQPTLLHFPGRRVRARDREVPRLRPVQEPGGDHHVPHLQGHPAGARLAAGQGQPAAEHHPGQARTRTTPTPPTP